jgi:hypothetical protein
MLLLWPVLAAVAFTASDPSAAAPSAAARSLPPVRFSRAAALDVLGAMSPRVRTTNPGVAAIIREGIKRSITFADLITQLGATDLIVYVERSRDLPRALDGRVLLLPMTHQQRYARAEIRADLPASEEIGVIAHELQHALEIAREASVKTIEAMSALYRRIGIPGRGDHSYDTMAAKEMGKTVRAELGGY